MALLVPAENVMQRVFITLSLQAVIHCIIVTSYNTYMYVYTCSSVRFCSENPDELSKNFQE